MSASDFILENDSDAHVGCPSVVCSATVEVFSSGGGTQSAAITALICQGLLPRPDFVVIADTGREMPTTWQYLDAVIRPNLQKIGIEVHRIKASEWANNWGREVFATNGDLLMPAYSSINNSKLSAFCSKAWKQEVVNRWLSQVHGLTRSKYIKWIGFSLDESRRWVRMLNGAEGKAGLIRLPLVHDVPTKRQAAIEVVEKIGWPTPPRSRCWCCPNQSDLEWAEVKEMPQFWDAAVELDESIRDRDPDAYLHSSIQPLASADLSRADDLFSGGCHSGECFL